MVDLPNSMSVSQELDFLYITYKNWTDKKVQSVFAQNTCEQTEASECHKTNKSVRIPVVYLNSEDLPEMINGKRGDPIEDHPFDRTFTGENIMKSFLAIKPSIKRSYASTPRTSLR
eukprot:CAMPEP_0196194348 /NCGR_PEP_ID=MMETSP0911-20130528/50017_1 /TAXON_ID=49265 /ORGANISM="Thalassiosira rotula, Strain GSO102" /LENGTH=115 /DNA_ID=CAMNT_0041466625 /DNA_START=424 /DNA_END=771 /DNA_ORIENTATION=-